MPTPNHGSWPIPYEKLSEWLEILENEPSIEGDGIDFVKKELVIFKDYIEQRDDMLEKEVPPGKTLTLNDLEVGKEYRLKAIPNVKKNLHGAVFKIQEKRRTKAGGTLQHNCGGHKAGTLFTLTPEYLEEA